MTTRAGQSRRLPETDSTIAYVQADGLVSVSYNYFYGYNGMNEHIALCITLFLVT